MISEFRILYVKKIRKNLDAPPFLTFRVIFYWVQGASTQKNNFKN
jgi:hypothetical protein